VKIPFRFPDRIELEKLINKEIVSGPVNHSANLKMIKRRIKNTPWQMKINGASLFVILTPASLRTE
jgi:energy-coupling factor transporter ATP-binding protein EcfA2